MSTFNLQSNAIRGDYRDQILNRTINEIHDDIATVFGPWAHDAFITKEGQPYYTRDGLEVLESLTFDNQLSEYIRKMIYQAAYDQGKKVGDGTTTMIILYTNMMKLLQTIMSWEEKSDDELSLSKWFHENAKYRILLKTERVETIRNVWKEVIDETMHRVKKWYSEPLTEERLLAMLYTCTQDKEFAAKVYTKLKQPLLDGAYIIPKKSNIESDLEFESYMNPLIPATRQFTLKPLSGTVPNTVIYHCNGSLDLAHVETLYGLATIGLSTASGDPVHVNIVLLCNGITDVTRKTTKAFVKKIRIMQENGVDISKFNNVAIYTLDRYREMDADTIEDLSTIITDEPGIGGLVNAITFESLIFQAFNFSDFDCGTRPIDDLLTFDCDMHHLDKIKTMLLQQYPVTFDDAEGLRLHKELGPVAQARYDELRKQIEEEKSEVVKYKLQKRIRTVYGQFIEVEVGSKLLKDSQRKFELLLDVIISAAEASRDGVVEANSLVIALDVIMSLLDEHRMVMIDAEELEPGSVDVDVHQESLKISVLTILEYGIAMTIADMLSKYFYLGSYSDGMLTEANQVIRMMDHSDVDPNLFNVNARIESTKIHGNICSSKGSRADDLFYYNDHMIPVGYDGTSDLTLDMQKSCVHYPKIEAKIGEETVEIPATIVEPVNVIDNILRNSILVMELILADTYHVNGFMQNYI